MPLFAEYECLVALCTKDGDASINGLLAPDPAMVLWESMDLVNALAKDDSAER